MADHDYSNCPLRSPGRADKIAASHVMKCLHIVNVLKRAPPECVRTALAMPHVAAALLRIQVTVNLRSRRAPFLVFSNIRRVRILYPDAAMNDGGVFAGTELEEDVYCTQAMINHLAASFANQ